jgi:hypothetical protein
LTNEGYNEALVDLFRNPRPSKQLQDEKGVRWDCQKIRLEGIEADRSEVQGEVCLNRIVRNEPTKENQY